MSCTMSVVGIVTYYFLDTFTVCKFDLLLVI